jgi:integrase/recombinase XerD
MKSRLKQHSRTRIAPDDMRRLVDAPNASTLIGLRDRALLATLAGSGLRASELATLTLAQIEARDGGYVCYVQGKTDTKPRAAHLSQEAKQAVDAWIAARPGSSTFIFTSFSRRGAAPGDEAMTETAVWLIVQRYAERLHLEHIKPHDFRRFLGTQLARKDIRKAQIALGHKSIETTARHYVLDELEAGLTDHLF